MHRTQRGSGYSVSNRPTYSVWEDQNTGIDFSADDTIDVRAGGTTIATVTSSGVSVASGILDINGTADALVLDADGDTTISAPTDDQIDIEVGGSDTATFYANGFQDNGVAAVTATAGGGTTGLIPAGSKNVAVTCDTATKQVSLPAASVGDHIILYIGANGCEVISAVAADKVNNVVVGATNELALAANSIVHFVYYATGNWLAYGWSNAGAALATLTPDGL
jgi:hypothetical protein